MIDGPSAIDPLVTEGPTQPGISLRPAVSEQRVLVLDGGPARMVDLAAGNIRAWENGPPVSIPCVSAPFDLSDYGRLQVQVLRDPRPTSVDVTLLSLEMGQRSVDVIELASGGLSIATPDTSVDGPAGQSPAIVILLEPSDEQCCITVRNAESPSGFEATVPLPSGAATLTIGGPSAHLGAPIGRRRLVPVLIDAVPVATAPDQVRRVAGRVRRAAASLRDRT